MLYTLGLVTTIALAIASANGQAGSISSSSSLETSESMPYANCEKYTYSCVDKDNKCKGDFYSYESMEQCNNGNYSYSCCKMPLHCSKASGRCVIDNPGEECTTSSDCFQNYFSSGLNVCVKDDDGENGTCVLQGNVGDSCSSDAACYGPMKCEGKKCVGVAEGGVCEPPIAGTVVSVITGFSCAAGLYCDDLEKVCKKRVNASEACVSDYMCGNGLVCNSGSCVSRFSLKSGDNCTNDNACGFGLLCEEGFCQGGMNYKYTECTKDSDCVRGSVHGTCDPECHHARGKHYCHFPHSSECKESYSAAYKCLEANGCSPALSTVKGTCGYSKCKKDVEKVFGCKSVCGHYRSLLGTCMERAFKWKCPLFSDGAKAGSAIGVATAIVGVLVATFVIARVMKTEDPYAVIAEAQ